MESKFQYTIIDLKNFICSFRPCNILNHFEVSSLNLRMARVWIEGAAKSGSKKKQDEASGLACDEERVNVATGGNNNTVLSISSFLIINAEN